jgi:hypothetical protein
MHARVRPFAIAYSSYLSQTVPSDALKSDWKAGIREGQRVGSDTVGFGSAADG